MQSPVLTIGERLKEIRATRNLTLEDVSKLTDVSKPMLGQIERGQSSPTITTLWKIAVGLKVPLSLLLEELEDECSVVDTRSKDAIIENDGKMRAFPVFPFDPTRNVEIFYIEFDPGCHHPSERHLDGVEEYVFVVQGMLEMVVNKKKIVLKENQALRFRANVFHSYNNLYQEPCIIYNMIFYPRT
ncbi:MULTISPECIES: helix-turn-helix domain-containing protein [Paenibacillus]|uniref:helix-turn-helix domain-containing protein n=1 Tax=Paenibacillus TaxID=44249 RepID=UPI000B80CE51|nr:MULTISPECIES: XRE family transcriptional regulator [Paenibacillus]MBD8836841.1 helix-turn-helix transcriptional regulator [Paenibacillus sp. CFBP 13594]PRA07897.1 XRE family transcriptional regulator [Paenibacillus sp. MYb63]PRA48026.1 XRE family transcriptional regulator [Paenibacillus sp. MYb67]QZN74568.1 XRE family transcriptional regulator [Paenibacillus sp. DR312]